LEEQTSGLARDQSKEETARCLLLWSRQQESVSPTEKMKQAIHGQWGGGVWGGRKR